VTEGEIRRFPASGKPTAITIPLSVMVSIDGICGRLMDQVRTSGGHSQELLHFEIRPMTLLEAARRSDVNERTIRRYVKQHLLRPRWIIMDNGRRYDFDGQDLDRIRRIRAVKMSQLLEFRPGLGAYLRHRLGTGDLLADRTWELERRRRAAVSQGQGGRVCPRCMSLKRGGDYTKTLKEVAQFTLVSERTLSRYIHDGDLNPSCHWLGGAIRYKFTGYDLDEVLILRDQKARKLEARGPALARYMKSRTRLGNAMRDRGSGFRAGQQPAQQVKCPGCGDMHWPA